MQVLGVGIVGAGRVAAEHLRAFSAHPHTEVTCFAARRPAQAEVLLAQQGHKADVTMSLAELLARDDVHIISVATTPDAHAEIATEAAAAGKHLLIEKAMALDLASARALRDAVGETGVKSVVGFVLRWNPLFNMIKTLLEDDAIGRVFYGEFDYFHGIGPWSRQYAWYVKKHVGVSSLLSAGCHAVDAMRWFMGGAVTEVVQHTVKGIGVDFSDYEYPPTSITLCRLKDGRTAKVGSSIACTQPYMFNVHLMGAHGTIRNNRVFSKTKFPGQTDWAEIPTVLPDQADPAHHPFYAEVDHLVDCIRFDRESHACVADAYHTHEICFAADQSGREGCPVSLPLD